MSDLTPTAEKLYGLMVRYDSFGIQKYSMSGLGFLVFGETTKEYPDKKRSSQGSALAVGRFVRELIENDLVGCDESCLYYKRIKTSNTDSDQ